jgi:hypothetical protein
VGAGVSDVRWCWCECGSLTYLCTCTYTCARVCVCACVRVCVCACVRVACVQLLEKPEAASDAKTLEVHVRRWRVVDGEEVVEDGTQVRVPRNFTNQQLLSLLAGLGRRVEEDVRGVVGGVQQGSRVDGYKEEGGGGDTEEMGGGSKEVGGGAAEEVGEGLEFAKVPMFGPLLQGVSKLRLKWMHAKHADLSMPVMSPPLGLRDGALLVVRDSEEAARFAASAAAAAQAAADDGVASGVDARQGRGPARAHAGRSRVESQRRRNHEAQLRIHVQSCPSQSLGQETDTQPIVGVRALCGEHGVAVAGGFKVVEIGGQGGLGCEEGEGVAGVEHEMDGRGRGEGDVQGALAPGHEPGVLAALSEGHYSDRM